jgi:hypothetical protein
MRRPWYRSGFWQTLAVFLIGAAVLGTSIATTWLTFSGGGGLWGICFRVLDVEGNPIPHASARIIDVSTREESAKLRIGLLQRGGRPGEYSVLNEWRGPFCKGPSYRLFWVKALEVRTIEYQAGVEIGAEGFVPQVFLLRPGEADSFSNDGKVIRLAKRTTSERD